MNFSAVALLLFAAPLIAAPPQDRVAEFYQIENIAAPPGVDPEIGGLDVLPDGRIAACFHHGQVALWNPQAHEWKIFAEGLHEPLGLLAERDGSLLVMQRAELTRLCDRNGDGVADRYETVWDRFGLSGNYCEFGYGPVRGPDGRLFVSLNLASNGAGIREENRGAWSPIGVPREAFFTDWKKVANDVGRMYSRVAWRGWVMELDPATGKAKPFACGFRSPDGIGFDVHGNLLVSDNQGDWRGTSELHVVKRGGFYGHPASLVWRDDWDGTAPLAVPVAKLDALRTPAAVWFPHNTFACSPTQPVVIPRTPAWGPFGGQVLIGEMNYPRLFRVLLEEVDGVWQGACVTLADSETLKRGLHRLVFSGDQLFLGRTHLSWAGGEGLAVLQPRGNVPFDPLAMHATPRGFRVEFTAPLSDAAADPACWQIQRYTYAYHPTYGSPQMEKGAITPAGITLSPDHRSAEVTLPELRENFVYEFNLAKLTGTAGEAILNPHIAFTLRRVPGRSR